MKITTILLIAVNLSVSAATFAQQINLSENKATLENVLKTIRQQSGYDIVYKTSDIGGKTISLNLKNANLGEALNKALQGQHLTYTIQDGTIIIKAQEEQISLLDKVKAVFAAITVDAFVKDETGTPLQGVNVFEKGTQNGAISGVNGLFNVTVPEQNSIIVFSHIGYETLELRAKDIASGSTIIMKPAIQNLKEVVINKGYYVERHELSTGDVATVTSKEISQQPVSNALAALIGRVPGLLITQSNGNPGSAFSVQIRGQNSISQKSFPLYVVDGIPYPSQMVANFNAIGGDGEASSGGALDFINPNDIESISILKDADATAIYGSRGANGVILITTKKGKAGASKTDFNVSQGFGNVAHMVKYMNTQQYLQMRHKAFSNDGVQPNPSSDYDVLGGNGWDTTRTTDWQKMFIGGTARYTDAQGSISGGNTNTQYLISGNYHRETTVFPGDFNDQRGGLHFNINNVSSNQKLTMQFSGSYQVAGKILPGSDLSGQISYLPPDAPLPKNPDGSLNWANGTLPFPGNPLIGIAQNYLASTYNLTGSVNLSYKILPNLLVSTSAGYNSLLQDEMYLIPITSQNPAYNPTGTSRFNNTASRSWNVEPKLSYNSSWGRSKLEALLGATLNQTISKGQQLTGSGYNTDALLQDLNGATTITGDSNTGLIYKYIGVYSRLNYIYDDRYIVNATARRDGSSRFGPGRQFGDFGSVGAAWIFSKEKFISTLLPALSFGKVRASYGTSGNDQIGDYQFLNLYYLNTDKYNNTALGLNTGSLFNPDLAWEVVKKLEIGFELGFFNDRVNISANYYRNRSTNQLTNKSLSLVTGFSAIQQNLPALVQNTGQEYQLQTRNIDNSNFKWTTNLTFSFNRNKLISYPDLQNNNFVIGQPLGVFRLFKFAGVDPQTGQYQFYDKNGNKVFNVSQGVDDNYLLDITPRFFGGLQNSFVYKQFTVNIFFQFVKQSGPQYLYNRYPGAQWPEPVTALAAWSKPGDDVSIQRYNSNYSLFSSIVSAQNSTQLYGDASYIRLKNAEIAYTFPESWLKNTGLHTMKIYIQGQNLLTLTHYIGADPGAPTLTPQSIPPLRVIVAGIRLTL